jgi:hypothetical protein
MVPGPQWTSPSEVNELLQLEVAHKWDRDEQSGRKLGAGVRMQMYGLVHGPLGSGGDD